MASWQLEFSHSQVNFIYSLNANKQLKGSNSAKITTTTKLINVSESCRRLHKETKQTLTSAAPASWCLWARPPHSCPRTWASGRWSRETRTLASETGHGRHWQGGGGSPAPRSICSPRPLFKKKTKKQQKTFSKLSVHLCLAIIKTKLCRLLSTVVSNTLWVHTSPPVKD